MQMHHAQLSLLDGSCFDHVAIVALTEARTEYRPTALSLLLFQFAFLCMRIWISLPCPHILKLISIPVVYI